MTDDDPVAQFLLEAVWADPDSDAPRMVYADYLLQRGDPLGELIAFQLDRARTGARASDREVELHQALPRHRAAEPLGPHLGLYSLERGFLAHAMPSMKLPHEMAVHPAWSTVTKLLLDGSAPEALLSNTDLRARVLAAREEQLVALATIAQPFQFTSLVAINSHWGLTFTPEQRVVFDHSGAFDHVRLLSLSARGLEELDDVLDTRLCRQLEHLDLSFTSVRVDDLALWLRWFETGRIPRVSFQIALGADDPMRGRMFPYRSFATHYTCFAFDRSEHVTLQISEPTEARQLANLLPAVDELCARKTSIEVHDVGDSNQIERRQALVLAALRDRFARGSRGHRPGTLDRAVIVADPKAQELPAAETGDAPEIARRQKAVIARLPSTFDDDHCSDCARQCGPYVCARRERMRA